MRIIKKSVFLFIFLSAFCISKAQIVSSYNFSPIMGSGWSILNGGSSVELNGYLKCLQVATGLDIFSTPAKPNGVFGAFCNEIAPVAIITSDLLVYPNPTRGVSILKCLGQFDSGLSGQLRITNTEGRILFSQVIAMSSLQAGFTINVSNYPNGIYMITIDIMTGHTSTKLIKL